MRISDCSSDVCSSDHSVRAGVDPHAVSGPAEAGAFRIPARHPDDAIIDVEIEVTDEPVPHLAHRQPVTHHHRPRADEAFPAGLQQRSLDGAPRRVRPIEPPHRLAMLSSEEHTSELPSLMRTSYAV